MQSLIQLKNIEKSFQARAKKFFVVRRVLQQYVYMKPKFRLISFGTCALIGLFGVMSYSVSLQTHELGVRMALGAQPNSILSLVLRKGLLLVGSGIVLGLIVSALSVRILQSQLWGVSAFDPWTLILAPVALLTAGLLRLAISQPAAPPASIP